MAPLDSDRRPPPANLDIDGGRLTALLCHMSCVFGLPVFLVAFAKRDNAFALHHAKAAACNFAFFYTFLLLSLILHPLFVIPMLLCYIPDLTAIARAARGAPAGHLGLGALGEAIFPDVRARPQLEAPPTARETTPSPRALPKPKKPLALLPPETDGEI